MVTATDIELIAEDAFKRWSKRARNAEKSVRIYSPYLDTLALTVLSKSPLEAAAKSVVTDLSPQSGTQDYMAQLKALRRLVAGGIAVRSLPRLHAKVLLTDGRLATVGSQNFTRYARESKETTALPDTDLSGTAFLEQLDAWYDEATPVTIDFLDRLIAAVRDAAKAVAAAQLGLLEAFKAGDAMQRRRVAEEQMRRNRQQALQVPVRHGLEAARRASRYRNANARVLAHLRLRESTARYYWTLEVSGDGDLNRWVRQDGAGGQCEFATRPRRHVPRAYQPAGAARLRHRSRQPQSRLHGGVCHGLDRSRSPGTVCFSQWISLSRSSTARTSSCDSLR